MGKARSLLVVTDKERTGWQLESTRMLEKLLVRAFWEHLPAGWWTVATGRVLCAEFGPTVLDDQPHPRDAWRAWVTALDAERRPEQPATGGEHRRVAVAHVGDREQFTVTLVARWRDREDG